MRSFVALALICAALGTAAVIPVPAIPQVAVAQIPNGYRIQPSNYTGAIDVTVAPRAPHLSHVWVFNDRRYAQGRGVSAPFAYGFSIHLRYELAKRSYNAVVTNVEAPQLKRILMQPPNGSALIVPGGILPDNVRSPRIDLFKTWLKRGGVVFWEGEPFDAVYSSHGTVSRPGLKSSMDTRPWPGFYADFRLFNPQWDPLRQPFTRGGRRAQYANFGTMNLFATTYAPFDDAVTAAGGVSIGFLDDADRSSISVLPAGNGHLVYFADGYNYEVAFARDVGQILWTGAWYKPGYSSFEQFASLRGSVDVGAPRGAAAFAYGPEVNAVPIGQSIQSR